MLLVVLSGQPPEGNGSEVAEGDEACDQRTVERRVRQGAHAVGNLSENNWGQSLSQGDAEEVNGHNVSLLVLRGGILDHRNGWSRVSSGEQNFERVAEYGEIEVSSGQGTKSNQWDRDGAALDAKDSLGPVALLLELVSNDTTTEGSSESTS